MAEAEGQGSLDREEGQLIRSAIRFDDLDAEDILTPRVDIVALEDTATMTRPPPFLPKRVFPVCLSTMKA